MIIPFLSTFAWFLFFLLALSDHSFLWKIKTKEGKNKESGWDFLLFSKDMCSDLDILEAMGITGRTLAGDTFFHIIALCQSLLRKLWSHCSTKTLIKESFANITAWFSWALFCVRNNHTDWCWALICRRNRKQFSPNQISSLCVFTSRNIDGKQKCFSRISLYIYIYIHTHTHTHNIFKYIWMNIVRTVTAFPCKRDSYF